MVAAARASAAAAAATGLAVVGCADTCVGALPLVAFCWAPSRFAVGVLAGWY
jgi:hypothetical protein